jgi:hypothetical protein
MQNQLADLEELLHSIKDESVRAYAKEAVVCYQNAAYRSAIVSIWVAVVFDLVKKIEYLAEQFSDIAAKRCLDEIELIRNNPKNISTWEEQIVEKAQNDLKLITHTEKAHLIRIRADRHLCAHPAMDREEKLFQPCPELVRNHIRVAIEALLSNPPIMGKAASDLFIQEIRGAYFPNDLEGIGKTLEKRILIGVGPYILDLFKVSLKNVLINNPDYEVSDDLINKYSLAFVYLTKKYETEFNQYPSDTFDKIFRRATEDRFSHLLNLIMSVPSLYRLLPDDVKQKFKVFLLKENPIEAVALPYFLNNNERFEVYKDFKYKIGKYEFQDYMKQAKVVELLLTLDLETPPSSFITLMIDFNIDSFAEATSFEEGKKRAKKLIKPVIDWFTITDTKKFIDKSGKNQELGNFGGIDQLRDCAFIMAEVFRKTIHKYPELLPEWKEFYEEKKSKWEELEELGLLITKFEDAIVQIAT